MRLLANSRTLARVRWWAGEMAKVARNMAVSSAKLKASAAASSRWRGSGRVRDGGAESMPVVREISIRGEGEARKYWH